MEKKDKNKKEDQKKEVEESKKVDKADEYLAGWQRAKADYVNLKKEMDGEKQKAMFYSKLLILADLLPIVGNLQKATDELENMPETKDNNWAQGFIHIAKQFDSFLEEKGIKRIETKDKTFDPAFHEAVDQEEKKEITSGTIIKEIEPGYTLNDEVIAPAKVIVAK